MSNGFEPGGPRRTQAEREIDDIRIRAGLRRLDARLLGGKPGVLGYSMLSGRAFRIVQDSDLTLESILALKERGLVRDLVRCGPKTAKLLVEWAEAETRLQEKE